MHDIQQEWRDLVSDALTSLDKACGGIDATHETPPSSELGDLAFPMYPFAKVLRKAPKAIAEDVARLLAEDSRELPGQVSSAGPYVNVHYDRAPFSEGVLAEVEKKGREYGTTTHLAGQKTMCEFSCPNTNKPLHVGHLRNDCLGESVSRILKACGAVVHKVNLINDRGIHICKSMLAYQRFGEGRTPESEGIKSDHLVGDYYVRYDEWAKSDDSVEEAAREMLRAWEKGDPETTALWERMNRWVLDGIEATYARTGVSFDRVYYESNTYLLGKEIVAKGLKDGVFFEKEDGSVWIDLSDEGLDEKALLRSDGTSIYVTQDLGTVVQRYEQWPFDRLIYVVGSEQRYHFNVLFLILKRLGYPWAGGLYHRSYGMVGLPEGKMKSREGTVVDADELLEELTALAASEIKDKGREHEVGDIEATAERIAIGALNYYLLKVTTNKDITFNPRESISFNGDTGPYLQYSGARISSVLRKHAEGGHARGTGSFKAELMSVAEEWELIKLIACFHDRLAQSADNLDPSILAGYLHDLAKYFNKYYHDNPILHNEDPNLVETRIRLISAVKAVLQNGLALLGIPFLEKM